MNCWKSFNLTKDHGTIRLILLSLLSMVTFFILFNIGVTTFLEEMTVVTFNPIILLLSLFFVIPIHKIMHCVPLWACGKRSQINWNRSVFLPIIQCHFKYPISKRLCIIVMLFPATIGTLLTIVLTWVMPAGMDYFGMFGALNFGLSAIDLIYVMNLLNAPHHAFIEDDHNGCKILIKQSS